jgi:hypothetical protein
MHRRWDAVDGNCRNLARFVDFLSRAHYLERQCLLFQVKVPVRRTDENDVVTTRNQPVVEPRGRLPRKSKVPLLQESSSSLALIIASITYSHCLSNGTISK